MDKFKPLSDSKIRQLRFIAFGLAFLLVATMVSGAAVGLQTAHRLNSIQSDWLKFRHVTAQYGKNLDKAKKLIESGASQDEMEQVNLLEICVKIGADMGPLALRDGRSIEVRGTEKPTLRSANLLALKLALRNLVENAIKYTAHNTKIIIEVTDKPAIKITDKGPGIPMEMREVIFNPFLRSDRRSGGSGLGLSIVRRVAKVLGATIKIDDGPGGGSVFTISFPPESLEASA